MSKIFQIKDGFCYWDATRDVPSLEYASEHYSSEIHFVETPDYVFEGWLYNDFAEGDKRFVQPTPPDGWLYDENTGTFYPEYEAPPTPEPTPRELELQNQILKKDSALIKAQLQAQIDRQEFIEDCIAEMAMIVYNA